MGSSLEARVSGSHTASSATGEDGGIDSNADRHRSERESWIHAEHAYDMLEVVPEIAHNAGACRKFSIAG